MEWAAKLTLQRQEGHQPITAIAWGEVTPR